MNSKTYTRQKTKKSKSNFYYSFLFLPKKKREALFAVYAFCRYSDDLVDETSSPEEARIKIAEWRKEIDACYEGQPSHPIMLALKDVIQDFPIPKTYLHELVDGMEMDLEKKRYATFDELSEYCYYAASVVGLICIEIFGYRSADTKEYAILLGKALQVTNILRDVGEDADKGRIYLPSEDYQQFHLTEEDILQKKYTPAFASLMRFEANRADELYQRAISFYDKKDQPMLFPAEIMRKIYYRILTLIIAKNFDVFHERVRVPNQLKIMIALQEWLSSRWRGLLQWLTMQ